MATIAHADPENFVVNGFTFIRPPTWKWVWDDKRAKIGNLLDLPGANTNDTASVFFRKFPKEEGNPESRTKAWQVYFRELAVDLHCRSSTKKVGTFEITYIEIDGTYFRKPYPDHSLIGATVQLTNGFFAVRMSGGTKLIEDSKAAFKQMLEQALKEKESE